MDLGQIFKKKRQIILEQVEGKTSTVSDTSKGQVNMAQLRIECNVRLDEGMAMLLAGLIDITERFRAAHDRAVPNQDDLAIRFAHIIMAHAGMINDEMTAQAKQMVEIKKEELKKE